MLIYFMAIWNILRTFGIFHDHLVRFAVIWYFFSCIMYQEKSGNPGRRNSSWSPCPRLTSLHRDLDLALRTRLVEHERQARQKLKGSIFLLSEGR
jgi:hypothetical protein